MAWLSTLDRYVRRGMLLGAACALVVWLLTRPALVRGIDEWLLDGCFHARGPRATRAKVVLVGVDEASLDRLGKPAAFLSPELAEVVTCLKREGAAAVGLDLIVPASLEQSEPFARFLEADRLGKAIYDADNVVLAKRLVPAATEAGTRDAWLLPLTQWRFKSLTDRARATDLGFVNLTADRDHFFRRQQLVTPGGDLHFALAVYAVAAGVDVHWQDGLVVGGERVPLDEQQCLRVNFVGPPGTFPVVPFHEALDAARGKRPLPADVRGAIVLIGGTGPSLQDYYPTPYGNRFYLRALNDDPGLMAGVELHGHLIATLVDRVYLHTLPAPLFLVVLLTAGVLLGDLFGRWNLEWGVLAALVHHAGWLLAAIVAFRFFRLRVEIVAMLLLGGLLYGLTFGLRWRRLRRMLGVVQSEAVARSLEAAVTPAGLQGEARVVTVLFADVRQFTPFSESHTPPEVVALLNSYYGAVVPLIEAYGGTLNQYMGDGVMVLFGAPDSQPDHALRAVRAAVAVVRRVHELRPRWAELGYADFRIGVGIHTGEVVVGMVGSPSRLAYTAIGDTVNAAARLEAENKRLGSEILLSAQTREALPDPERASLGISPEHGMVQVKGKSRPLDIYRIDVPGRPEGAPGA
jgi:adenylate cyclase